MAYSRLSDCYYIYEANSGIWKKSIDISDPVQWKYIDLNNQFARSMQTDKEGELLVCICLSKRDIIAFVLDKTGDRTKEIMVAQNFNDEFKDHLVVTEGNQKTGKRKKVIALSLNGSVVSYLVDPVNSESTVTSQLRIELIRQRYEETENISICPKKKFLAVSTQALCFKASRILILERKDPHLILRNSIDLLKEDIHFFRAFGVIDYFGNHLVMSGFSYYDPSFVYTYDYDFRTNHIFEVKHLRRALEGKYFETLEKVGDQIWSCDCHAKLMRLKYTV